VVEPVGAEPIAVFRYDGTVAAVSNVCWHPAGPLGEGRVMDGCITCPWHGYQYPPEDGCSPPPFNERIATCRTLPGLVADAVRVRGSVQRVGDLPTLDAPLAQIQRVGGAALAVSEEGRPSEHRPPGAPRQAFKRQRADQ